jgi:hypothetical protein
MVTDTKAEGPAPLGSLSDAEYYGHEFECMEAAMAILIERAPSHSQARDLTRERNMFRRDMTRKGSRPHGRR